jgi:hypothetical protein
MALFTNGSTHYGSTHYGFTQYGSTYYGSTHSPWLYSPWLYSLWLYSLTVALLTHCGSTYQVSMIALFDHEEVGSESFSGAGSPVMGEVSAPVVSSK